MTEKLNWSKLGEMKPYAPTGPGRYLMRCGGVVEFELVSNVWKDSRYVAMYWNISGRFCLQENHPFDIIAPAPDVLPWEECERLKAGIFQAAISCGLTPADGDTATHTLNRIIAKVRTLNVARSEADIITELHQKQIADLLQRVAKLEMQRTGRCGIDYQPQVVTTPQEMESNASQAVEPVFKVGDVVTPNEPIAYPLGRNAWRFKLGDVLIVKRVGENYISVHGDEHNDWFKRHFRHVTPAERAAFFAANPTMHPAYKPEHGDMAGWRYLELGEEIKDGDEFLDARKKWHFTYDTGNTQRNPVDFPRRRSVQAEKEVG